MRCPCPHCSSCGGLQRPQIVWFGESLDPDDLEKSYKALENCDILLTIGTSGVVQPAASFATLAKHSVAYLVEINLEPTPFKLALQVFRMPAANPTAAIPRR